MVVEFLQKKLPAKWQARWPVSRIMNDVLIVLVVLLGFIVVSQKNTIDEVQADQRESVSCIRQYLVDQSKAQSPRSRANEQTDIALAKAIKTIPPLLRATLDAGTETSPFTQKKAFAAINTTNDAFIEFNENFEKLQKARASFPISPAPEDLCKE